MYILIPLAEIDILGRSLLINHLHIMKSSIIRWSGHVTDQTEILLTNGEVVRCIGLDSEEVAILIGNEEGRMI
jgi:hypothetical protein